MLPLVSYAADYYAAPSDQGNNCTEGAPCGLNEAMGKAFAGDTVILKNGTYSQCFKTVRAGSSGKPITFRAQNRHQAIIRHTSCHSHIFINHSFITFQSIRADGNDSAFDGSKIAGDLEQSGPTREISDVIFEDNYVHDTTNLLIWAGRTSARIEVRYNTFDNSGVVDKMGEGNYYGSSHNSNPAVINTHHNIFSKYKANCVDMKGENRNVNFHDNICMDHKIHQGSDDPGHEGDGTFVLGWQSGDGDAPTTNNRITDNIIYRAKSNDIFSFKDKIQVTSSGNVIVNYMGNPPEPRRLNRNDQHDNTISHSNIHCPDEGVSAGKDTSRTFPNNQVNRPMSECTARIDEIVGVPEIASCNIGNVDDNTITVEMTSAENGPISLVEVPFEVTYDGVAQTGEITTHTAATPDTAGSNQARIAVVSPPANNDVTVRVVAPAGSLHNSAFIGGKNCTNGNNYGNASYTRGAGFCGENKVALTEICTNTITGGGPIPVTEALNQAVWRFYAAHNGEGVNPTAPENTDIPSRMGGEFRWRVGVRGGGNNSPSRSYVLAARVCKPACGQWLDVGDDPNVGIVFLDDEVQVDGTATTNQLSLGGKTFLAGHFIDIDRPTPAKAIASTQQIEWEFSLKIPNENTTVEVGDTIELRIEHNDGTVLSAYDLPSITVLGAGPANYGGSITGSIK